MPHYTWMRNAWMRDSSDENAVQQTWQNPEEPGYGQQQQPMHDAQQAPDHAQQAPHGSDGSEWHGGMGIDDAQDQGVFSQMADYPAADSSDSQMTLPQVADPRHAFNALTRMSRPGIVREDKLKSDYNKI